MKFTSEDLMKAMGLKVGDRVKVREKICPIIREGEDICYQEDGKYLLFIGGLIDEDFEILPQPKRVGDLKCSEYGNKNCNSCPIRVICIDDFTDDTLYNKLELAHKYAKDQEIYDILKARLDKEME